MNHGHEMPAYGLWTLVIINSAIFIIFAFSFFKPKTKRDWRTGNVPLSAETERRSVHHQAAFFWPSSSRREL